MNVIQLLLIGCALLSLVVYIGRFRSALLDRLIAFALFVMASLAVIFPEMTSYFAHLVGVGRGTDLVLYLFMGGSVFAALMLYSRVLRMDEALTEVVRAVAIRDAEHLVTFDFPGSEGQEDQAAPSDETPRDP